MRAQVQHYVPKFILRQFLVDEQKEQVAVYDKHTDKNFVTTIKNIMAERAFHDFAVNDDLEASFEPVITRIEELILPLYRKVIQTRRLDRTPETQTGLALLMAFQFIRTKAHREVLVAIEEGARQHVEAVGWRMEDLEGWEPQTENVLKRGHIRGIRDSIAEYTNVLTLKDFLLAEPSSGRSFYLGDNPVCMHNEQKFGPYGNLGLALPGIEIYMPLTADLMLCAWSRTNLAGIHDGLAKAKKQHQSEALAALMAGKITGAQMKEMLESMRPYYAVSESVMRNFEEGRPIPSVDVNMDYYNSLQCGSAYRYVVCKHADFELAKRHNKEHPNLRKGRQLKFD